MSLFATLKRNARRALKGNWGTSIAIVLSCLFIALTYAAFSAAVNHIFAVQPLASNPTMQPQNLLEVFRAILPVLIVLQVVGLLFCLLLFYPVLLGVAYWNLQVVRAEDRPFSGIFHFFENFRRYGRAILYSLQMMLRQTFWAIVFLLIPSGVLSGALYLSTLTQNGADRRLAIYAGLGVVFSFFLYLLATILYLAFAKRYFLVPYLLGGDDEWTVGRAIRESVRYTQTYRFRLLWFDLSFLGWVLLCVPLPPLLLYVIPYRNASVAMFAQYMIERQRQEAPARDATREFASGHAVPEPSSVADARAVEPILEELEDYHIPNEIPSEIPGEPPPQEDPSDDAWPFA